MQFTQIKETCIYIKDVDISEHFYHNKLGLEVISKVKDKHIFFKVGSSVLLCFIAYDSKNKISPPPHYGSGKLHFALEVDPVKYQSYKSKIRELDIEIIDEVIWESGQESFYFHDPDEHVLEIVPKGIWEYKS